MDNKELEIALNQFGYDLVKALATELRAQGKSSTGELINSLQNKLINTGPNQIEVDILSEDYLEVIDKGRKPGKQPPIAEIKKWAQIKGIDSKYVYPIAKSIGKKGIKATNIIDKVISANKQRYLQIIADAAKDKFEKETIEGIQKEVTEINKNYK